MADAITVKCTGFKELADKLREMGRDVAEKALKSAVRAAAVEVKKEAQRILAPMNKTGTLSRSIYVAIDKENSTPTKKVYVVGWRKGLKYRQTGKKKVNRDGYYGLFIEFGTAKMAARPFIRPAFERKKQEAVDVIASHIAFRIAKFEKVSNKGGGTPSIARRHMHFGSK